MPATISSTFTIEFTQAAGQGTATITNPGRGFRVLEIFCTGTQASVITVRKNTGAGATVGTATLGAAPANNELPCVLTEANVVFTSTDDIHITIATADATKVALLCSAESGQALTVV